MLGPQEPLASGGIDLLRAAFDQPFYLAQLPDPSSLKGDALQHFSNTGWRQGLNPHPLFSTRHYQSQISDSNDLALNPLLHYLLKGYRLGLNPHPLFDTEFYQHNLKEPLSESTIPLLHYLEQGHREASPHQLFGLNYYREQLSKHQRRPRSDNYLIHYVTDGALESINPHPLFNQEYYLSQRHDVAGKRISALEHYLVYGSRDRSSFHPLFNTAYYVPRVGINPKTTNELLHFLSVGHKISSSHILFDPEFYRNQLPPEKRDGEVPLIHYLTEGAAAGIDPHPMFSTKFYRTNYYESRNSEWDSLSHYLLYGANEKKHPHPLFDGARYWATYPNIKEAQLNPLIHYVTHSAAEQCYNPCWGITTKKYLAQFPEVDNRKQFVSEHLFERFKQGKTIVPKNVISQTSLFDNEFCSSYANLNSYQGLEQDSHPIRIIFTSHEASRTGAPLIILKIAQILKERYDCECFFFLLSGGELEKDFAKLGTTINCQEMLSSSGVNNLALLALSIFRKGRTLALCNSAQSSSLVRLFASLDIPTYSLVHEFSSVYDPQRQTIESIIDLSRLVVFPCQLTKLDAEKACGTSSLLAHDKMIVMPTGMLKPELLTANENQARLTVCNELGISDDTFIVLGMGSVDYRKGCEFFIAAAQMFRTRYPQRKTAFIWVGEPAESTDPKYQMWIERDIRYGGLKNYLYFIGSREKPDCYFHAADAFLNLSRLDPFPCVVLEAMATSTPVILFDNVNGAAEAIRNDAGFVVPFLDLTAVVDKLNALHQYPALAKRLGQTGRNRVINEYCIKDFVENLLEKISSDIEMPQIGTYRNLELSAQHKKKAVAKRKLYFITPNWSLSGVNSVLEHLVSGLQDKGWDASLLFTQPKIAYENIQPPQPFQVLEGNQDYSPQQVWEALKYKLEAEAPCVAIVTFDQVANSVTSALSSTVGVVGLLQSDQTEYYESAERLGRYWNRIVAVSQQIAKNVVDRNSSFAKHTCIINNSTVSATADRQTTQTRRTLQPIRLVYSGRIVQQQKRIRDFIQIVDALDSSGINYNFSLIGEDCSTGLRSELESIWSNQIANGRITFHGRVAHQRAKEIVQQSDIFLMISEYEGFPLAMLEAMAGGCIPIATPIASGVPEIINCGVNGYILQNRNWDELVTLIRNLQNNTTLFHAISEAAVCRISQSFLSSQMVEGYHIMLQEVFEEITSGNYRRPETLNWFSPKCDVCTPRGFSSNKIGGKS